jgi:PcRGLX-like protein C-terminal alpha/alpha toroid domain/PcRGLX-like protein central beta sandwich domain/Carbohydrate family 9 binding domain-like/PcRGLX-like N-terminal RIFT barrel domain
MKFVKLQRVLSLAFLVLSAQIAMAANPLPIPVQPLASKARVPFTVSEAKGVSHIARPVSGALPLARGVLQDPRRVRLMDAEGKPVPVQTRVTGYWPEGTVKWLLLDFIAPAGSKANYILEYGTQVPPYSAEFPIARKNGPAINIDTGAIRIEFSDKVSGGIAKLWRGKQIILGGESGVSQSLSLIHTKDPGILPRPEMVISKAAKAPVIDGKLDDAVWKQAKAETKLVDNSTAQPAPLATQVRVLYDDKNIYFGVRSQEPPKVMAKIAKAQTAAKKKGLWSQPVFEVFLDVDGDEVDFNQILLNAAGVSGGTYVISLNKTRRDKKIAIEYKVGIQGDAWIAEARIPFSELANKGNAKMTAGHRLGLFFGREISGREETSYSWTPTYGQWHLPTRFGKAYLSEKPAKVTAEETAYAKWDTSGMPADMEPLLPSSLNTDKQLSIPVAKTIPAIDGKLVAAEWNGARSVVLRRNDEKKPSRKTEVMVQADKKTLFVAFRCFDTDRKLRSKNKNWWDIYGDKASDGVRIQIDANHDGRDIQTLAVNPAGHNYHTFERHYGLPFKWQVKAGTFDKGWVVEMAIPLKELARYETPASKMGINFMRWSVDTHEEQVWSPCDSFPDDAKTFGTMTLAGVTGESPVSKAFARTPAFKISEMTLEENGPVKAVVVLRGQFTDGGVTEYPTTMRVYAYKSLPVVRVVHSFVYGGKPWEDFVRNFGLKLNLAGELGNLTATVDKGLKPTDPDAFTIWDVSGRKAGVSMAMQWARRLHPKDVVLEGKARTMDAQFWSGPAVMDLRRAARHPRWKYYSNSEWGCATGLGLTNEIMLDFHGGGYDKKRGAALGKLCDQQSIPVASPEYNCSTLAFGRFVPPRTKGDLKPMETRLRRMIDVYMRVARIESWDGIFHWGDYRYSMDAVQGDWPLGSGLHSWLNGEAKMTGSCFLQFLRTGDRKYFDWAEVMTRNSSEVPLIHYGKKGMAKYVGAIHRHNSQHWNGGIETRYTPHHGWALYYFQTGDMRIFDIFKNELKQFLVELPVNVWYADYGSRLYYHMRFWEMTNDKEYRDRIDWFLKETIKYQKKDGKLPFVAASNWPEREYVLPRKYSKQDYFQTYGTLYTMVEYYDLTGDPAIKAAFLKYAGSASPKKLVGYGAGRATLASYYRISGSKNARKRAIGIAINKGFYGLFPKEIDAMTDKEVREAMKEWHWSHKTVHPFYIVQGMIRAIGELAPGK